MLEPFTLPFVQRGLVEVLILSIPAGILGSFIVLRGFAFFSHAVGTAAFPGLVLADGLGFGAAFGAFGAAMAFTGLVHGPARRREGYGALTAMALVACLAGGVILASDVFGSGSNIETLLFGTLLLIDRADIALAAVAAVVAVGATILAGERWLAVGFDPAAARAMGVSSGGLDLLLLSVVALATTAALTVVGALLVTSLFVVPAVTVSLFARRLGPLQAGAVALCAAEGAFGLWLSVKTDAPAGATIATVSGVAFALAALVAFTRRTA